MLQFYLYLQHTNSNRVAFVNSNFDQSNQYFFKYFIMFGIFNPSKEKIRYELHIYIDFLRKLQINIVSSKKITLL